MTIQLSYAVCGVQRSGSSMLCKGLASLGIAGDPQEYYWNWVQAVADDYGDASYVHWAETPWAREARIRDWDEFDRELRRHKTGTNGVFGVQVMASYLDELLARLPRHAADAEAPALRQLDRWLGEPRYLRLVRRDQVLQAVSTAIAAQTGVYNSTWPHPARAEPVFEFDEIDSCYETIRVGERRWDEFFATAAEEPLRLVYEEFADDYPGTLQRVLDHLAIPLPPGFQIGPAPLARQATPRNLEWAERYRERKGLPIGTASPSNP